MIKNTVVQFLSISAMLIIVQQANGQYPSVPKDVQQSSDSMMKEAHRKSEIAWAKALPVIEADARNGKPFIPWASRFMSC